MSTRIRQRRAVGIALIAVIATTSAASAEPYPVAVLRGLDKVAARTTTLYVPVGESIRFGTLQILADVCDKRPPEETPESAAFLEIVEQQPGKPAADVFRGWMFASSPGLSAMQHPVYDLWVLDCVSAVPEAAPRTSGGGSR
jgi:hypothetical protein